MRHPGRIHYAKLDNSPRLQRLYALLQRGPATTREIVTGADICAVNTAVDELRENGISVICESIGKGRYQYRLEGLF